MIQKSVYREEYKKWLKNLGYSQSSLNMLPSCLAEFLGCLEEKGISSLLEINPKHIHEHYEYLTQRPNKRRGGGLSSRMINHNIYAIRLFLNYQEQLGTIKENPISGLSFPSPENTEREILTTQEIKKLYEMAESLREKAIIGIFYGCGLRRSEGVALNLTDISFKSSLLYIREGKGCKRRVVPINEKVLSSFKNYQHYERFIIKGACTERSRSETAFITSNKGTRTSGNSYNKVLKALIKKAEITKTISLHNLRHSIATHLLENGLSVEYVRDFLGHKHLESTQIYTRISDKLIQEL